MHDVADLFWMGGPFMYLVLALGVMGVLVGTATAVVAALGKWTPSAAWLALPVAVVLAGVVGTMLGVDMALQAVGHAAPSERSVMAASGWSVAIITDLTGLAFGSFLFAATALFGGAASAIGAGKEGKWTLGVGLPPIGLSVLVGGGLIAWAVVGRMEPLAFAAGGAALFGLIGCGLGGLRVAGGDDGPGKTAAARVMLALCAAAGVGMAGMAGRLEGLHVAWRATATAAPEARKAMWDAGQATASDATLLGLVGALAVLVFGAIPALPLLPKLVEPRTVVSAAVAFVLLVLPLMAARLLMAGGLGELGDIATADHVEPVADPEPAREVTPVEGPGAELQPLDLEELLAAEAESEGLFGEPSTPMETEEAAAGGLGTRGTVAETDLGDPIVLGALDKAEIDRVIKRHLAQVRYCYQRVLTKEPGVEGKLIIKFVIAKDGSVSSATVKPGSTLDHPEVGTCVTGRFMRMRFPEPSGGGIVIVSYPFVFRAG